jgi:hypothetical protein
VPNINSIKIQICGYIQIQKSSPVADTNQNENNFNQKVCLLWMEMVNHHMLIFRINGSFCHVFMKLTLRSVFFLGLEHLNPNWMGEIKVDLADFDLKLQKT